MARKRFTPYIKFLLACLAFGVGLGNVWRFPYLVQKYGGGSFIIPFLVMMFVEAMPLLLVELGLGQKFRSGSVGIWNKLHPYFQGIFGIIYRLNPYPCIFGTVTERNF